MKKLTISNNTTNFELITPEADRRNPSLAAEIMVNPLCYGLNLRQDLETRRSGSNQGNIFSSHTLKSEFRIPFRRVHHLSLKCLASFNIRPLPFVQDASCRDIKITGVNKPLQPGQVLQMYGTIFVLTSPVTMFSISSSHFPSCAFQVAALSECRNFVNLYTPYLCATR